MPRCDGVLETSLYVQDLDRSVAFYHGLFGFEPMVQDERLCALSVLGKQVLLLFRQGGSPRPTSLEGRELPGHDARGQIHLAFAIATTELPGWEKHLQERQVAIESRVHWPRGGQSLYFRDPDGHLLELVTPGCWPIY